MESPLISRDISLLEKLVIVDGRHLRHPKKYCIPTINHSQKILALKLALNFCMETCTKLALKLLGGNINDYIGFWTTSVVSKTYAPSK